MDAFGVTATSRQPYDNDGVASVLTSSHGFLMGWWLALSCLTPEAAC
jgi:hypothetical protein